MSLSPSLRAQNEIAITVHKYRIAHCTHTPRAVRFRVRHINLCVQRDTRLRVDERRYVFAIKSVRNPFCTRRLIRVYIYIRTHACASPSSSPAARSSPVIVILLSLAIIVYSRACVCVCDFIYRLIMHSNAITIRIYIYIIHSSYNRRLVDIVHWT